MTRRVMVIGVDGMPQTLLYELAEAGVMPHAARLLRVGECAQLRAPVPEISSTSWASFLTGTGPAEHGIFGFVDLEPGSYRPYFPNAGDLRAAPLWEYAASAGLRTLCLNVPGTYPAAEINGVLVSGFVAPRWEGAVTPARLLEPLRDSGYELDVEVGDVVGDPAGFVERVCRALRARTRSFTRLLRTEPWDLAIAVLTETDRYQHFLWHTLDPGHPLHSRTLEFYRLVDSCLGKLLDEAPDAEIFLVSDHGFGPARSQVYVNTWLRQQGLLAPLERTASLAELDGESRVFALDPARFYVHRRDRYPRGSVTDRDAEALLDEVAEGLLGLRWDGVTVGADVDGPTVVQEVLRATEVYDGPLHAEAPDLVAVPAPEIQLRGGWTAVDVTTPSPLTGTHTRGNALFYAAGGLVADHVEMADVAPTVLAALGVDAPGMSGRRLGRHRRLPT